MDHGIAEIFIFIHARCVLLFKKCIDLVVLCLIPCLLWKFSSLFIIPDTGLFWVCYCKLVNNTVDLCIFAGINVWISGVNGFYVFMKNDEEKVEGTKAENRSRNSQRYILYVIRYQTGYIMWHSRLMIYIPWGACRREYRA